MVHTVDLVGHSLLDRTVCLDINDVSDSANSSKIVLRSPFQPDSAYLYWRK